MGVKLLLQMEDAGFHPIHLSIDDARIVISNLVKNRWVFGGIDIDYYDDEYGIYSYVITLPLNHGLTKSFADEFMVFEHNRIIAPVNVDME